MPSRLPKQRRSSIPSLNKYYVDEAYDYAFTGRRKVGDVRLGVMGLGEASSWFDSRVIDGTVNGAGWMTRAQRNISSWWDKWIIDGVLVNGPRDSVRCCPIRCACWSGAWCSGTRWSW